MNSTSEARINIYMVTIRKHQVKDYVKKEDIDEILIWLKWKYTSLHFTKRCYELDKKYKQLHFHGICEVKEAIYYRDSSKHLGFRIFWKPVYDMDGAIEYIEKDTKGNQAIQENILTTNYLNHNNFFNQINNK